MRIVFQISVVIFLSVILTSCSSGSNRAASPTTSPIGDISTAKPLNPDRGVFGMWQVMIDTSRMTAEVLPARNSKAIGNIFDADLSQFLTVAPCENCLSVRGVYFDGYGDLNLVVRMKHPFANLAARPDLHGFDVRGIFILAADKTDSNIKVMRPSGVEEDASWNSWFLNPDGYTSHFDELSADARYFLGGSDIAGNLNPFLRFFEDYATTAFDPQNPDGNNVMPVGSSHYERTAVFGDVPEGSLLNFYIVADVSYGQSAVFANRTNPQYYLPAFHRTEAWRAEYWIENNTLMSYSDTSTADIVVQVFDWQHGATVDPDYPNPSNLSGIPEQSDVLMLELSIPAIQDTPVVVTTPEAGYGTPQSPLRYRLTVTNQNRASYMPTGLLAIRDTLHGQASPHARMPIPASPAGFPYETSDILDYTLYIPVTVPVLNGSFEGNYVIYKQFIMEGNEMWIPQADQLAKSDGTTISTVIHPLFVRDMGHKKFQYKWDYDYDGVTFDLDGSGAPSPVISFATPGSKNIGLRIRDNAVPPNEYIYEIPVFAEGEAFIHTVPYTELNRDIASSRKGQAIDVTADNLYYVYAHDSGTSRNINLAIMDRTGEITTTQISDTTDVCFSPTIDVIGSGENQGVYIAYCRENGVSTFIYATHGTLEGTGFASNTKRITTNMTVDELQPCIIKDYIRLNVFYTHYNFPETRIYCAYSEDYGDTWDEYGWMADDGSTMQRNPTAVETSYQHSAIIYEDYMHEVERGIDLYMVKNRIGYMFEDPMNISIFDGAISETEPSCGNGYSVITIAYLAYPAVSAQKSARLKILNPDDDSQMDFPIDYGTGTNITHTQPSVDVVGDNTFIYSFGSYNTVTHDLTCNILNVTRGYNMNTLEFDALYEESVGSAPTGSDGRELYPAVACYKPIYSASENFIAFRDYLDGSVVSSTEPKEVMGQISVMYFVTEYQEP